MRAGIAGLLPADPAAITTEHARRLRALGFTGASVFSGNPAQVSEAALRHAREVLAGEGIRVAQTNPVYPALVHPDPQQRAEGVRLAQRACHVARVLDAAYLLVRSGSVNPAGNYTPHRENHALATVERLIDSLRQVCLAAEQEGVLAGLECHVITTLDSPRRVREIIEAVGSPALRYNADPVNFVGSFAQAYNSTALVHEIFAELGPYMVSAHVKDVSLGNRLVVHIDECAPGEGIFDLATFLRLYEQHHPEKYALIEHLPDSKVPAAKAHVDALLAQLGIAWRV